MALCKCGSDLVRVYVVSEKVYEIDPVSGKLTPAPHLDVVDSIELLCDECDDPWIVDLDVNLETMTATKRGEC